MADIVDRHTRSRMMAGIKSKNTKPEILIRKALHARGVRYRLYRKDLPGKPDLVLPKHKAVILINGCFWHGHSCHLFRWPASNIDFWQKKIQRNKELDQLAEVMLEKCGWRVLVVWECATKGKSKIELPVLTERIMDWIMTGKSGHEILGG